jgi:twitching motility protein PilU
MRQAPDCILIGEIRDKQTMGAALAYAQSGHLVLATLHANNAYNALNRIISFYPLENRAALLQDLASSVKAIVSQRLVRSSAGGRRQAAVEIMVNTRYVADLIKLVKDGLITQEEALANADSATNLLWLINNATAEPGLDAAPAKPAEEPPATSFTEFTLDT